jgi:CRP-like cAMP-binding protein
MTHRTVPLLEVDPDLGQLLAPERRASAERELLVTLTPLRPGTWDAARLEETDPGHVGLLVLEGMMAREVVVADNVSTELIGPGDLIRPWRLEADPHLLPHAIRWTVLTPMRLALLDRAAALRLARYPEIGAVLIDRLNVRAQRLAVAQAISQVNRVERRLLALFWHLAERWGRVTATGVVVPLDLSHRVIGQLIGARRPTVSSALGELAHRGELLRRRDGTWALTGEPIAVPQPDAPASVPPRRRVLREPADQPAGSAAPVPPALASPTPADRTAQLRTHVERLREATELEAERLQALCGELMALRQQATATRVDRQARVAARRRRRTGAAVA